MIFFSIKQEYDGLKLPNLYGVGDDLDKLQFLSEQQARLFVRENPDVERRIVTPKVSYETDLRIFLSARYKASPPYEEVDVIKLSHFPFWVFYKDLKSDKTHLTQRDDPSFPYMFWINCGGSDAQLHAVHPVDTHAAQSLIGLGAKVV